MDQHSDVQQHHFKMGFTGHISIDRQRLPNTLILNAYSSSLPNIKKYQMPFTVQTTAGAWLSSHVLLQLGQEKRSASVPAPGSARWWLHPFVEGVWQHLESKVGLFVEGGGDCLGFSFLKAFLCQQKSQNFANPTGNDLLVVASESLQKAGTYCHVLLWIYVDVPTSNITLLITSSNLQWAP